ncbi:MAG: hypothetical protein ACKVVP_20955 [Chloroflexota bacterium]
MTRKIRPQMGGIIAVVVTVMLAPMPSTHAQPSTCFAGNWRSTELTGYMRSVFGEGRTPFQSSEIPEFPMGTAPTTPALTLAEMSGSMNLEFSTIDPEASARIGGSVGRLHHYAHDLRVVAVSRDDTVIETNYRAWLIGGYILQPNNMLTVTRESAVDGEALVKVNGTALDPIPLAGLPEMAESLFGPTDYHYECRGDLLFFSPILNGIELTPQVYQRLN